MVKRAFAWLLCAAMLFSAAPALTFGTAALEQGVSVPRIVDGDMKLTGNMTVTEVWEISGAMEMDLNGFTLTLSGEGSLVIPAGGKLTCKNGTITGATNGAIDVSGTLELTKVTMTGNATAGTGPMMQRSLFPVILSLLITTMLPRPRTWWWLTSCM